MVLVLRDTTEPSASITLRCRPTAVARVCNSLPIRIQAATATPTTIAAAAAAHHALRALSRTPAEVRVNVARFSSKPVQSLPNEGQVLVRPAVPRIPPQPRVECILVGGADAVGVHPPDPNGSLFV